MPNELVEALHMPDTRFSHEKIKNLSHPPFSQNQNFEFKGSMQITCINGFLVPKFLQILDREVR